MCTVGATKNNARTLLMPVCANASVVFDELELEAGVVSLVSEPGGLGEHGTSNGAVTLGSTGKTRAATRMCVDGGVLSSVLVQSAVSGSVNVLREASAFDAIKEIGVTKTTLCPATTGMLASVPDNFLTGSAPACGGSVISAEVGCSEVDGGKMGVNVRIDGDNGCSADEREVVIGVAICACVCSTGAEGIWMIGAIHGRGTLGCVNRAFLFLEPSPSL